MRPNVEIAPTNEGLIRIQNEISEVEKREMELRNEHAMISSPPAHNGTNGTNGHAQKLDKAFAMFEDDEYSSPTNIDKKDHFKKNKIIEPQPKPQLLAPPALTRAYSTPQLFQVSPMKKFNINSPHKGIMQRFIASRGKLVVNQQYPMPQNNFKKNLIMSPIEFNNGINKTFTNLESVPPANIERDEKGRPVRKGFVPVEEKIQCELRDLKNRECELKKLHKLNLRDSDDEATSEMSDDWSPINGKLSKSIDALNSSSLSPSHSPESRRPVPQPRTAPLRPAVSLAQLIDLATDSEEVPSSHKLIEFFEKKIITENKKKSTIH